MISTEIFLVAHCASQVSSFSRFAPKRRRTCCMNSRFKKYGNGNRGSKTVSEEVGHPATTVHRVCGPVILLAACRFRPSLTTHPGPAAGSPERTPVLCVLCSALSLCSRVQAATFLIPGLKYQKTSVGLRATVTRVSQVRHLFAPCRKPHQLRSQWAHGREPSSSAGRWVRRPRGRLWVSAHQRSRPCISSDATHGHYWWPLSISSP